MARLWGRVGGRGGFEIIVQIFFSYEGESCLLKRDASGEYFEAWQYLGGGGLMRE